MATISIELKGIDSATQVVNNVKVSLNQLHSQAQSSGDGIAGSLRRIGETAAGFLTAQAIPAMLDMGRQALSVATSYESAMNIMQAVSGATAEQMALVGQRAKELGADMTLPATSAGDAAAAMTELVKSGLSVGEAMESARGVLQLSAAGALSNADAATIAANALNAFRNAANGAALSSADMGRVADILAAGANASSASVHDLALGMQMAASSAASSGVPFQSLVAMLGQMSNAGIAGSDAGTSLKTMLMRLQAPTDKAAEVMKALGLSIFDAQGAMVPIQSIIGQFSSKLGGLTQEQRNATLATIFGSDAIRAANTVLMGGVGAFDAMSTAVGRQGAAADLAKAQMAGLGGAFQGLKSQIETALLELAEPTLPFLEGITRQIADAIPKAVAQVKLLAQQVMAAVSAFQAGMASGSPGAATAGFLAALGLNEGIAGQIGAMVAQINSAVQTGLAQITAAWAAHGPQIVAFVQQILGALGVLAGWLAGQLPSAIGIVSGVIAFFVNNWQAVATAVGVVLGVLAGGALSGLLAGIGAAFAVVATAAGTAGGIIPLIGTVIAALGGPITLIIALVAGLAAAWATNFLGIRDIAAAAWAGLQPIFMAIGATWQSTMAQVGPVATAAWGAVTAVFSTVAPVLSNILAIVTAAIKAIWSGEISGLGDIAQRAWATVQTIFSGAQAALPIIVAAIAAAARAAWVVLEPHLVSLATQAWEGVKALFNAAWAALPGIVAAIVEGARAAWAFIQPHLVSLATAAWDGAKALFNAARENLPSITAAIIEAIKTAWAFIQPHLVSLANAAWEGVKGLFRAAWEALPGVTASIIAGIKAAWEFLQPHLVTLGNAAWDAVKALFRAAVSALQTTINNWWNEVKAAFTSATNSIQTTINTWWGNVKTSFTTKTGEILTGINTWWESIKTSFTTKTGEILTSVNTWWEGLKTTWGEKFNGIKEKTDEVWGLIKGTFDEAVGFLKGLIDKLSGAFKGVSDAIKGTVTALGKLASKAREIGDSIPAWMRPGSPMPLGLAFEHLQGATAGASAAMGQFGDAAKGASSAPVVDIRLLLNGQTVASAGAFGATLAAVIEALVLPLAGLHEAIDSRVAGTLQRVADSLKHVQTMFETVFKIIGLIADAPTLPNVGPNSPTLQFVRNATSWALAVATAAANSAAVFEEVKTAGLTALATAAGQVKTLLEGTFSLIGLATNPPALTSVAPGSTTLMWFGNVTTWTRAVTTAAAQAAAGFETLETAGLQAVTAAAGQVKTLIENAHKLVTLSTDPPGLTSVAVGSATLTWFGNVTTWTRAVTTASAAAAAGFELLETGGLPALTAASGQVVTLVETARKLIELSTKPPGLTSVAVGSVVLTWFANVTTWTRTVTTAAAQAATGFETLETAGLQAIANAVGPVKTLVEGVLALVSLTMRPPTLPDVPSGSALYNFFRDVAGWARGGATLAANAAAGFEELRTDGLTAVTSAAGQVKTLIDAVLSIVESVAFPPSLPVIAAGSTLHTFLVSLLGFARSVAQIAAETAAGFETVVMEGLQALAKAVGDALKVLKDTLDLLIVANTEFNIPTNFADTIKLLTRIGIEMAGAYLEVASTFTGIVTPAATEAAKAMDMAAKFVKDVYDLAKQIVKDPPAFPSNFQDLIRRLVQMGKEIAVVFIDEANTFATNVGPGAVALLSVYGKMDDFFKGFNKAVNAVSDIASVPTDAAAKVKTVMAAAVAIANEYITAANGFEGVKGQGAANLEGIIAGFQQLMKSVKDVLKTLADWGTAGVQSSEIAPALAIFASILASLESMVNISGVTAGTGYIVRFAENVRSNATLARDALLEVMVSLIEYAGAAGRSAGLSFMQQMAVGILAGAELVKAAAGEALSGASAGASKASESAGKAVAGGSGGASAGGGTTTINNDNRSTVVTINVVNSSAAAARATNEGLASLPLFN